MHIKGSHLFNVNMVWPYGGKILVFLALTWELWLYHFAQGVRDKN